MAEINVRKRGKKWQYQFEAAKIEGKRKQITKSGFNTKKEALEAGTKALAEYNNSGQHFTASEISVSDYFDYWYENYVVLNLKPNTQSAYTNYINNHIKPNLGMYKLKALTPSVLQNFINSKMINGFSKSHLENLFCLLSGALKYAVEPCRFIQSSPMFYVKMPKYELSTLEINRRCLSLEEFNKITERFPYGTIYYIPIMIGYYTGLRIGEVLALTWDDIDLEKQTVTVNKNLFFDRKKKKWYFGTTKTATSNRTITIGNTLTKALKKHKIDQAKKRLQYGNLYYFVYEGIEKDNNKTYRPVYWIQSIAKTPSILKQVPLVCTKDDGEPVTINTLKYASRIINYSLKIPFNFHSLRHTHATILIENGAEIKAVQMRLGHADIKTTYNVYVHHTSKMANDSVDIFENAVKQNKSS